MRPDPLALISTYLAATRNLGSRPGLDPRIQDAVLLIGKSTRYSWLGMV